MNSIGRIFRVSIWGESHGAGVGVTIDGVKPGLALSEADFETDLARRRSGVPGTTPRHESDVPELLSGVFEGHTTGAPITVFFRNTDVRSADYDSIREKPRPGHADAAAAVKFNGFNDYRGGGQFSGRMTVALVAAGVVAKKMLPGASFNADIAELEGVSSKDMFDSVVISAVKDGDSLGGVVQCCIDGIPAGVGEPFWDSVEGCIAHALFAIPGVKGVEFGEGFESARKKGSEQTHEGGVSGGICNGERVIFRVAFKPASSVQKNGIGGRHDACYALRCPVIVEAAAALVLADLSIISGNGRE